MKLIPASAGDGRYFVHVDKILPAFISNVEDTTLSTTLSFGGVQVRTVEHIISALEGLGVDNCRMELEGGNEVRSKKEKRKFKFYNIVFQCFRT